MGTPEDMKRVIEENKKRDIFDSPWGNGLFDKRDPGIPKAEGADQDSIVKYKSTPQEKQAEPQTEQPKRQDFNGAQIYYRVKTDEGEQVVDKNYFRRLDNRPNSPLRWQAVIDHDPLEDPSVIGAEFYDGNTRTPVTMDELRAWRKKSAGK